MFCDMMKWLALVLGVPILWIFITGLVILLLTLVDITYSGFKKKLKMSKQMFMTYLLAGVHFGWFEEGVKSSFFGSHDTYKVVKVDESEE